MNPADIIIIDTGAGVSNNVLSFILGSDETIIVTTPETTAITDAYGIIKSIYSLEKDIVIKLVVNRVKSIYEGRKVADRIINIAFQFLSIKVENLNLNSLLCLFTKKVICRNLILMISVLTPIRRCARK